MERKRPTLKNKITTTIALTVIFLGIFLLLTVRYFVTAALEPEIANRISAIIALIVVFSIAISIFIGLWLSGEITKPVLGLNKAARRMIEGDLDVRIVDIPKNLCWEIMGCNYKECPAYGHFFERCWFIAGTLCEDGIPKGIFAQKIENCRTCKVYNSYQPDEIMELSDTFNYMARHLKETIEKLNNAYKEVEKEVLLKTEELQIANNELFIEHEKIKRHEQELILINKELDSFVYTVSHDLKEPLRGIETFSRFLLDDYWDKLDDEGKDYLKRISQASHRLKLFIDDLLALSRISRIKNPYETFEPNDIIKDVLKRLDAMIKERDVKIKIDDSLPLLYGDKIKIKEIFYNLILNGIKYNDKKPMIEIAGEDKEKEVVIYIKDNGIGIKEEDFHRIFEPFKRLHKRNKYEGGMGVGLAIIKRVMDEHKGKIWIESKVGEGSTFYFNLPKRVI